jgi:hypothetical protein
MSLAENLLKQVSHLTKEAALDRMAGEIESFEIREKSHLNRIDVLKKTPARTSAARGKVTKNDLKQTAKMAGAVALGVVTASVESGTLSLKVLGVALLLGLSTFLNRLVTNGGAS